MCGIIAYLGKNEGGKYALEGIKMLRNRGYDSVGCCSVDRYTNKFVVTKYANRPDKDSYELFEETFNQYHHKHTIMSLHTRWATTGVVNDSNSHPHLDTLTPDTISVVHNGIISNYSKLKEFLKKQGISFRSETDTEVISNLISYYYSRHGNGDMMDAIKLTLQELEGTWALIIMNVLEPNTLYVCKKGSPILVGYSEDMCIVSSEVSGFSNYLRNYHIVEENQIIKISMNGKLQFFQDNKLTELSSHTLIHQTLHQTSPDPFPHWTLKEIMEQPDATMRALNQGGRLLGENKVNLGGLKNHTKLLLNIKHLTIIASGTSMHAGMIGQKFLQNISGFDTVRVVDASEFMLVDLCYQHSGILVLSQSGETRDIVRCLEQIREHRPDVLIFSIVNVVESLIAREVDCGVYLNAGREVGVASTKSFTNQVVVIILNSIWFSQSINSNSVVRTKMISSLHRLSNLISRTLDNIVPSCHKASDYISEYQHVFILGRDKAYPIAMEGALKIKEISYIHAEAYPGGALKHGPLALITKGTPIIILRIGDSDIITKMDIAAEETKSRGAYLIAISSVKCSDSNVYDQEIIIPKDQFMEPILSIIPLQYIAYLLSIKLGHNPDFPRNLAKCVVTD